MSVAFLIADSDLFMTSLLRSMAFAARSLVSLLRVVTKFILESMASHLSIIL